MTNIQAAFLIGFIIWPLFYLLHKFSELGIILIDKWIERGEPITRGEIEK